MRFVEVPIGAPVDVRICPYFAGMQGGAHWLPREIQSLEVGVVSSAASHPEIGQWYERTNDGEIFQVTGIDENAKTIELQAFYGAIDEIDAEAWAALPLELAESPEDWTGPIDDMEADDLACSEAETMLDDPAMLERQVSCLPATKSRLSTPHRP
jgi:hypothetical protein